MLRRVLAATSVVATILVLAFTVLLSARNKQTQENSKKLRVLSQTRGNEALTAELSKDKVKIRLTNNHRETITAFAIRFEDMTVKEDFVYSEVHFGIEPGETFEKEYPSSSLANNSDGPTISLLTVVLKNGSADGNSRVSREIKDERLGEKTQILRTLRILEKDHLLKDSKITRSNIIAALNAGEVETRTTLKELEPTLDFDAEFSNDLKNGLHWGREKILQRFEKLEQMPAEFREQGFVAFRDRINKLLTKL